MPIYRIEPVLCRPHCPVLEVIPPYVSLREADIQCSNPASHRDLRESSEMNILIPSAAHVVLSIGVFDLLANQVNYPCVRSVE